MTPRLILMSGLGGAGTSTLAEATVCAAVENGASAALVDASGSGRGKAAPAALQSLVAGTLGLVARTAGAEGVAPELWSGLPSAALAAALDEIREVRASVDLVVVDAGPLGRLRDLVLLPSVMTGLLDACLTPRMAMWRAPGAVQDGEGELFPGLSRARTEAVRWHSMLVDPGTSVRLVGRPTKDAVDALTRAAAVSLLLGMNVEGVALPRFPRRKDGDLPFARKGALAAQRRLEASGLTVWRPSPARPVPKGSEAAQLLGSTAGVLRAPSLAVTQEGRDFILAIPLFGPALEAARVGTQGTDLVVEYEGVHRWIELPSVLQRCTPVDVVRTSSGLTMRWSPDEGLWPSTRGGGDS